MSRDSCATFERGPVQPSARKPPAAAARHKTGTERERERERDRERERENARITHSMHGMIKMLQSNIILLFGPA